MKVLSNMRIGQRLTAGFAVVIVCLMAMAGLGYIAIQTLNAEISQLISTDYKAVALANKAKTEVGDATRSMMMTTLKAAQGNELVAKDGSTMQGLVASVQRTTDIMGDITHASAERSSSIERATHTIRDMDKSTQQNPALVDEAAAAAGSLPAQAQGREEVVSLFKLDAAC